MQSFPRIYWLAALLALMLAGCNGGRGASLSGQVTLDGQPLDSGTLQFVPASGQGQPVGVQFSGGRYEVNEVPVGKVNVTILSQKETGETEDVFGTMVPKTENAIPDHYASGISIEVPAGKSEKNFELTSQRP